MEPDHFIKVSKLGERTQNFFTMFIALTLVILASVPIFHLETEWLKAWFVQAFIGVFMVIYLSVLLALFYFLVQLDDVLKKMKVSTTTPNNRCGVLHTVDIEAYSKITAKLLRALPHGEVGKLDVFAVFALPPQDIWQLLSKHIPGGSLDLDTDAGRRACLEVANTKLPHFESLRNYVREHGAARVKRLVIFEHYPETEEEIRALRLLHLLNGSEVPCVCVMKHALDHIKFVTDYARIGGTYLDYYEDSHTLIVTLDVKSNEGCIEILGKLEETYGRNVHGEKNLEDFIRDAQENLRESEEENIRRQFRQNQGSLGTQDSVVSDRAAAPQQEGL